MKDNLLLSFFADGPYAMNLNKVIAYPKGVSHLTPFRYRIDWIQPTLQEKLRNKLNKNINHSAILGMRFQDPNYKDLIIPIRNVSIEQITSSGGFWFVFFVFQEMVDYTKFHNIDEVFTLVSTSDSSDDGQHLFTQVNRVKGLPITNGADCQDREAWSGLISLIMKDKRMPIKKEVKNSIFLKFDSITKPKKIYKSKNNGTVFGFAFPEGKHQELVYYHIIPSLIGQNKTVKNINYKYEPGALSLELNRNEEEINSNYQNHTLVFTGTKPNKEHFPLKVTPEKDNVTVDKMIIHTCAYEILVRIIINRYNQFKTKIIWYISLIVGLIFQSISEISVFFADVQLPSWLPLIIKIFGGLITTISLIKIESTIRNS